MATIDIGKLTFTHKGDYAGGTAYVANDVVYYNGSAYIAKTSTTGNLPTSTAHWNTFTAGSGGIWNAGLSLGSAGQVVKVNSGASALEFGTISSDYVKVVTASGGGTTALALDNCFSADYENYIIVGNLFISGGTANAYIRLQNASNTEQNSGQYRYAATQIYKNASATSSDNKTGFGANEISMQENVGTDSGHFATYKIYVAKPFVSSTYTNLFYDFVSFDNTYLRSVRGSAQFAVAQRNAGFRFSSANSNTFSSDSKVTVYGIKE